MSACHVVVFFFLMIRRPPRSTLDRSSAASDVYKRQGCAKVRNRYSRHINNGDRHHRWFGYNNICIGISAVSYTHLRAHETVLDLVCRLLLEKKKQKKQHTIKQVTTLNNREKCLSHSTTAYKDTQ